MASQLNRQDTIAAIATPAGRGGVGIVRVSGPAAHEIAASVTRKTLQARQATFSKFYQTTIEQDDLVIDEGIAIYFAAPNSFTAEDVVELQGHGGPVVMNLLLAEVLALGARLARPGEFSERAYLNGKLDLSQAEAIADLIDSSTQKAAQGAIRSLQGEFSTLVKTISDKVLRLRMFVEAAIDFPEEEIDFLSDDRVESDLLSIGESIDQLLQQANQGALLREGISLVLAGRPNVGKSSLMNQLSGRESSIVTSIAGTTRDLVHEHIQLEGVPLRLVDTAGIREASDEVEAEGIKRAIREIENADGILALIDISTVSDWQAEANQLLEDLPSKKHILIVLNKSDLLETPPPIPANYPYSVVAISAKSGWQLDVLQTHLKQQFVIEHSSEGMFLARTRHVDAIKRAQQHLQQGQQQLQEHAAGELLAEDLRLCHEALCEITGEFTSDDLLGEIFSSFCIGK